MAIIVANLDLDYKLPEFTKSPLDMPSIRKSRSKMRTQDFLVVQWLRIRLPMQGTRVRALLWEDPTCRGAAKPVRHNY